MIGSSFLFCRRLLSQSNRVFHIKEAIQVCYELNKENKEREIKGLLEALDKFKLKEGIILTYDQDEEFEEKGITIKVIPIWKWLLETKVD